MSSNNRTISPSFPTSLSPELARSLVDAGATIVILDLPIGTTFGIDYLTWTTAEKFRGVKMIPPGIHFAHYTVHTDAETGKKKAETRAQATSSSSFSALPTPDDSISLLSDLSPRIGFFISVSSSSVHIYRYHSDSEGLEILHPDKGGAEREQYERIFQAVKGMEMDEYLGPYPLQEWRRWKELSGWIEEDVVRRLQNEEKDERAINKYKLSDKFKASGPSSSSGMMPVDPCSSANSSSEPTTTKLTVPAYTARFTHLPSPSVLPSSSSTSSPSLITSAHFDKSPLLSHLLATKYENKPELLLGELQFSFILVLIGQSYEGLEQWKGILKLLSECAEAMETSSQLALPPSSSSSSTSSSSLSSSSPSSVVSHGRQSLYIELLRVLIYQLNELPRDWFLNELSEGNFIVQVLDRMEEVITEMDIDLSASSSQQQKHSSIELQQLMNKLVKRVEKKFGWKIGAKRKKRLEKQMMRVQRKQDEVEEKEGEDEDEYAPVVVDLNEEQMKMIQ